MKIATAALVAALLIPAAAEARDVLVDEHKISQHGVWASYVESYSTSYACAARMTQPDGRGRFDVTISETGDVFLFLLIRGSVVMDDEFRWTMEARVNGTEWTLHDGIFVLDASSGTVTYHHYFDDWGAAGDFIEDLMEGRDMAINLRDFDHSGMIGRVPLAGSAAALRDMLKCYQSIRVGGVR